ncbi:DUF3800 domain-containing protein [Microcella sp.]|uniref:DUF3800 domain-containing protein n=1 Tax=Microcella sp. TaxID=1913979 RepID=UPI00391CBEFD
MRFAFVDESYSRDRYFVGAYVVHDDQLAIVKNAVRNALGYAKGFGIGSDAELHGYEIMSGKNDWSLLRGKTRAAISIYRNALAEIASVPGARAFVEGVDIPRLNARYRYPQAPHQIALRHLLEKLNDYASRVGDRVLVIADEVPDQQAHAMRMASYQSLTTGGYKPSKLSRIEFPITFGKSAESPGIQCADMIVYLHRRIDANEHLDERAANTARDLWTVVKPLRPVVRRWDP